MTAEAPAVLVQLRVCRTEKDWAGARSLLRAYASELGLDLGFQSFEEEVQSLPGPYRQPSGAFILAREGAEPIGCVGIRRLHEGVGEMKRLHVLASRRGEGLGRRLALEAIEQGRKLRYRQIRLDTLPAMTTAQRLYTNLGFRPIEPYQTTPLTGTVFMALDLSQDKGMA